jgi:hypothetical protein
MKALLKAFYNPQLFNKEYFSHQNITHVIKWQHDNSHMIIINNET